MKKEILGMLLGIGILFIGTVFVTGDFSPYQWSQDARMFWFIIAVLLGALGYWSVKDE